MNTAVDVLPFSCDLRWRFEGNWEYNFTEKRESQEWGAIPRRAMKGLPAAMNYSLISGLRSCWACLAHEYWCVHLPCEGYILPEPQLFSLWNGEVLLSCPPCYIKTPDVKQSTFQLQINSRMQSSDCIQVCGLAYKSQFNLKGSWNAKFSPAFPTMWSSIFSTISVSFLVTVWAF